MSLTLADLQPGFLFKIASTTNVVPEPQYIIVKIGKTSDNKIITMSKQRLNFLVIEDVIKAMTITDCYKMIAFRL